MVPKHDPRIIEASQKSEFCLMSASTEDEPGILVAEDTESDRVLIKHAFARAGAQTPVRFVNDGQDVVDYLRGAGPYTDRRAYPLPTLLILDLNMPRMTGLDVLKWLTTQPDFKRLPAIVLSSSGLDSDVEEARRLGASDYHVKPHSFGDLIKVLHSVEARWFSTAEHAD
jgi:CheY-like chemotaxis protein